MEQLRAEERDPKRKRMEGKAKARAVITLIFLILNNKYIIF